MNKRKADELYTAPDGWDKAIEEAMKNDTAKKNDDEIKSFYAEAWTRAMLIHYATTLSPTALLDIEITPENRELKKRIVTFLLAKYPITSYLFYDAIISRKRIFNNYDVERSKRAKAEKEEQMAWMSVFKNYLKECYERMISIWVNLADVCAHDRRRFFGAVGLPRCMVKANIWNIDGEGTYVCKVEEAGAMDISKLPSRFFHFKIDKRSKFLVSQCSLDGMSFVIRIKRGDFDICIFSIRDHLSHYRQQMTKEQKIWTSYCLNRYRVKQCIEGEEKETGIPKEIIMNIVSRIKHKVTLPAVNLLSN